MSFGISFCAVFPWCCALTLSLSLWHSDCKLQLPWSSWTLSFAFSTQAVLGILPGSLLTVPWSKNSLKVVRANYQAHVICFFTLRDHSLSLSDIHSLTNCHFIHFVLLLVVSWGGVTLISAIISWPEKDILVFFFFNRNSNLITSNSDRSLLIVIE